jgi:molecular chaperone DnaK (HSP70)
MSVVGFDFGTTNSLISVIVGDRAVDVVNPVDGRPFPSVVRYEGARTIVGRDAKDSMEAAGVGIHGNVVLSPKFLLGQEIVHVGGVERSPVDIVHDVVAHVKDESLGSPQGKQLDGVTQAVVTIPITMDGPRRAALRDAFRRADIGITQFVHEPLAALYGYFRSLADTSSAMREYDRRNLLVVDWGGGTLDLTLCRLEGGRIRQIRNGGSDELGGDRFDEAIRNGVIERFCAEQGIGDERDVHPDARLRLLHDSEQNKIDLSKRDSVTFYRPGFFRDPQADLELRVTRSEMEAMTRHLVSGGINQVEALLDAAGIGATQVSLCLVTGGMAAMPAISSRLHELFGSQRVSVPDNSASLIANGAAWIAHDRQRLRLAKPIELRLARGSFMTLMHADTEMPSEHEVRSEQHHLYCTDPTDGFARFELCMPARARSTQRSDPREALGTLTVRVDKSTKPFRERLALNVAIDDDLILRASAYSAEARDEAELQVHDLEFSLRLEGAAPNGPSSGSDPGPGSDIGVRESGSVVPRTNVHHDKDNLELVPGEVLYWARPGLFDRRRRPPLPQAIIDEYLYYQPCAVCKRSWSDPGCHCISGVA